MREEWRTVEENHNYEVSDCGSVRHVKWRGLGLKPARQRKGYLQFSLSLHGVAKNHKAHRLVCRAFHGPQPEGMPEVDHINYVTGDNRACNLRWISAADNRAHSRHRQQRGNGHHCAKLTEENALEIRRTPHIRGMDTAFAARFGVSRQTIRNARRGETWGHIKPVPADEAAPALGQA